MAYQIVPGDVVEWTMKMKVFDQVVMNVHHFHAAPTFVAADSVTVFDAMNTELGVGITSALQVQRDATSFQVTFEQMLFQKIHPIRFARRVYVYNQNGNDGVEANTANVAAVITKYTELSTPRVGSLHTGQVGSMHLPGVPRDKYAGGVLTPAYLSGVLFDLATELTADFADPTLAGLDYVLWHPHAVPKSTNKIVAMVPQDTVRIMRRRTLRVGQ